MAELALDTDLSEEQREYIETVRASAGALLTVINDILDFSKIEAGKMQLDCVEFDLIANVRDIARIFALQAQHKCVEVVFDIRPDVPEMVLGDPTRLRQVLTNLLGNALKFTASGEIELRLDLAAQNVEALVADLHFSVRDTGIGIPAEKHGLIFESFTQAEAGTTRRFGGSGLGLTISKRLVETMGGRLWFSSEVHKGSVFEFTVKVKLSDGMNKPAAPEPVCLEKIPVLVVDDNATNRRIVGALLKNWAILPTLCEDAEAALVALREARYAGRPFPLMLADCHMPEVDGFALADRIKQDSDLKDTRIIMMTSAGVRGDLLACRRLEVEGHLAKPIGQAELKAALWRALRYDNGSGAEPALMAQSLRPEARCGKMLLPEQTPLKILVADDNPINQRLAQCLLEKHGHDVLLADDGSAVLQILERETVDLVLMDVQMPNLDGLEATRILRAREAVSGVRLPVIAMTAHAMRGDREQCFAAGMDGYITKPIHGADLLDAIALVSSPSHSVPYGRPSGSNANAVAH